MGQSSSSSSSSTSKVESKASITAPPVSAIITDFSITPFADSVRVISAFLDGNFATVEGWLANCSVSHERAQAMLDVNGDGKASVEDVTSALTALLTVSFKRVDTNKNGRIDDHEVARVVAMLVEGQDFADLTREYMDDLTRTVGGYVTASGGECKQYIAIMSGLIAKYAKSSAGNLPLALCNTLPFTAIAGDEWKALTGSEAVSRVESDEEMQAKIKEAMEMALRAERQAAQRQAAPGDGFPPLQQPLAYAGPPSLRPEPYIPHMRPELPRAMPQPPHHMHMHMRPERAEPRAMMRPEMPRMTPETPADSIYRYGNRSPTRSPRAVASALAVSSPPTISTAAAAAEEERRLRAEMQAMRMELEQEHLRARMEAEEEAARVAAVAAAAAAARR